MPRLWPAVRMWRAWKVIRTSRISFLDPTLSPSPLQVRSDQRLLSPVSITRMRRRYGDSGSLDRILLSQAPGITAWFAPLTWRKPVTRSSCWRDVRRLAAAARPPKYACADSRKIFVPRCTRVFSRIHYSATTNSICAITASNTLTLIRSCTRNLRMGPPSRFGRTWIAPVRSTPGSRSRMRRPTGDCSPNLRLIRKLRRPIVPALLVLTRPGQQVFHIAVSGNVDSQCPVMTSCANSLRTTAFGLSISESAISARSREEIPEQAARLFR